MKNYLAVKSAFIALFAAIISLSSFIKIPIGSIPLVLQNAICVLVGSLLGGFTGGAPILLFLISGLLGLPVYSGGTSGIGVLLGPTGGFLFGYLLGGTLASLIAGKPKTLQSRSLLSEKLRVSIAIAFGMIAIYIPGLLYFAYWVSASGNLSPDSSLLQYTVATCLLPYLPGDVIKTLISIPIALQIRPIVAQYLYKKRDEKVESS